MNKNDAVSAPDWSAIAHEALEVLAGEHGLRLENLAPYSRVEVVALGARVIIDGPNRVERPSVIIVPAEGAPGLAYFKNRGRGKRYSGDLCQVWPLRGKSLEAYLEERAGWLAYQRRIEEERKSGAAG